MTPLFVIPARGGSKGIPGKNIRPLAGKPLIVYSIEVALTMAPATSHVIVSTDSEDIAAVAREAGADVPWLRPAELATDTAGSREVILHAMDQADAAGVSYDCVVLLQPTSPLRTAADVEACLALYTPDIDMVVTVKEAACNPYYDCFETDPATGYLHVSKGDGLITRRQDAPKAWQYNGAVYVINPQSLRAMPLGAMPRRVASPMPAERSIDLDTLLDWQAAENILASPTNLT
ncbi:MAG: acylneuraminate cytidylyltransferase family protein [Duncaniella sp.]|nr:acylneuraminate cytidylyltransferase family protein [Duncaniella sp.]